MQEIDIPEKDLKGKNQVIEKLDILVRIINNLINFKEKNHKLDEKLLFILSIINKVLISLLSMILVLLNY